MAVLPHADKPPERGYYGPPPFYTPTFSIPRYRMGDLKFALSQAGNALFEEWLDCAIHLKTAAEWVMYLFNFTLLAHFRRDLQWEKYIARLLGVFEIFCRSKFIDKFPVALYSPNALGPLFFPPQLMKRPPKG